jgi:hypothetical protein
MKLHLLAAASLRIERSALAAEFQQATGRPLRRTGVLPALALLTCLRCLQREAWAPGTPRNPLPTLLLWHTRAVIAEEASPLIRMMLDAQEAVMPYDFLASQPALMGVSLHAHFSELSQAICLPWADETGAEIWQRSLLLAAHGLGEHTCGRVICLQLDREAGHLGAHALSLALDVPGPQALATLDVGTGAASSATTGAADFVPRLSDWLHAGGQTDLHLDSAALAVRASRACSHCTDFSSANRP